MNVPFIEGEYRRKIKTVEELAAIIGAPPRERKVVMCHGTFDVVHPGHIRHLLYARQHADVLIASLTDDTHIAKASFRPFVPEDLRAMNLAALEVVDYVVIDRESTPLKNLELLKPDYFAKGYEYVADGVHPKTAEETVILDSYGGEILFTPGDVIYSSSAIIDQTPPNIAVEKLLTLMQAEKLDFGDLRGALGDLAGVRVHVVGDTIVDSHTHCVTVGGMTKTPTISVRHENQTDFAGGAAVVARHLRAAGAGVVFSTVLGDDARKDFVLDELKQVGVACDPIIDPTRPTTNKNVIIAEGHRLLKIDTLDNRSISDKIVKQLCDTIKSTRTGAVVLSDFRHGIFNRGTIPALIDAIPDATFRVADSQVASRWGNILEFKDFDLITPNEREARFALGDQDSVVRPLARQLYTEARCKTLMLKLGDRGVITYRAPTDDVRAFLVVDSFAGHVVDAVGAGDALLAYATLSMITSGNQTIASILGSFAAGIECEQEGNMPVTRKDVLDKIAAVEKLANFG